MRRALQEERLHRPGPKPSQPGGNVSPAIEAAGAFELACAGHAGSTQTKGFPLPRQILRSYPRLRRRVESAVCHGAHSRQRPSLH